MLSIPHPLLWNDAVRTETLAFSSVQNTTTTTISSPRLNSLAASRHSRKDLQNTTSPLYRHAPAMTFESWNLWCNFQRFDFSNASHTWSVAFDALSPSCLSRHASSRSRISSRTSFFLSSLPFLVSKNPSCILTSGNPNFLYVTSTLQKVS